MSVTTANYSRDDAPAGLPWMFFLGALAILSIATPLDFFYTLGHKGSAEIVAATVEEGSITRRVALLSLAALAVHVLLFQPHGRLTIDPLVGSCILFFLLWCALSVTWAEYQDLVARRLVVLALLWAGAFAFAARCSLQQIMTFNVLGALFTLLVSIIAELSLGTYSGGPRQTAGTYRFSGVIHPNQQGWNCGTLIIAATFLYMSTHRHRKLLIAIILAAAGFLLLTKSRTSIGSVVFALGTVGFLFAPLSKKLVVVLVLALITPVSLMLIGDSLDQFGQALLSMGRETSNPTSLTGRIPLWEHLFGYIELRPIAGFGYDGFWTPSHVLEVSIALDWKIVQAHSGWVSLILDLGYVGLVIFVLLVVLSFAKSLRCYRRTGKVGYLFAMTMLIWISVTMLTESLFFTTMIHTFVCMSLFAHLAFVAQDQEGGTNAAS